MRGKKPMRIRALPERFGLADAALTLAGPLFLLLLLEGFTRGSAAEALKWIARFPLMACVNYGFFLGVCLLIGAAESDRARAVVTLGLGFVCAALGVCNRYKLYYRMEPLLFTDAAQLGEAAHAATGLRLDIDLGEIAWIAAAFAAAILLCAVLMRGRRRGGVLLPLAGVGLVAALWPLCTFSLLGGEVNTDLAAYARAGGTLYTAVAAENNRRETLRVDYSEREVREGYRALAEQTPAAEAECPNVILVLSESFADEAWLGQYLRLTRELTPFYNEMTRGCRGGRLYAPKVGGGTSETEFEVLTGLRSKYSYNPYSMGLPPVNSLASVLRNKGLRATAIHLNTGVYYNRYANLRMEGFDAFYTTDTTTRAFEKTGQYVSDAEHYRAALAQLNATEERDFVFVITMQNHGGYAYDDFRTTFGADTPFADRLSEKAERTAANYCWLLGESDRALEMFLNELEAFEEPVIVAFFGDHIPPFGTDVYEELGVAQTGDESHMTPYFVWSNRENTDERADLYAWELGAYILSAAGVNDDPFFHYIEQLRQEREEKPTGAREDDALYDLLSYDALFGAQYAYAEGGLAPENERFQIGGEMRLLEVRARLEDGQAVLEPVLADPTQAYELEINGEISATGRVDADARNLTVRCVMRGFSGSLWNQSNALEAESVEALLAQSGAP